VTPDRLSAANLAAVADSLSAASSILTHALAIDPARLPLAKAWLMGLYMPAWLAEAKIPLNGRDLADVEADVSAAWPRARQEARTGCIPALWPSLCDSVRDVVREAMQGSVEAAVRLPIHTPEWAATESRIWAIVEACIWTIAWRAVARSKGEPVAAVVARALGPRRLQLQQSAAAIVLGQTPPTPKVAPPPHQEHGVLFNADAPVLAFMREHLPTVKDWGPCKTLGILRDGGLIGGIVFNNYHPEIGDVMISAAFSTAQWARPRTLRRVFAYPFIDLGCKRLTDHVPRRNKPARAFAEKAGFRLEGVKKGGFDGRQDLILYGMLRKDCRFLKGA
jgi:RimJ/RimL family protein N-acetyltransferase